VTALVSADVCALRVLLQLWPPLRIYKSAGRCVFLFMFVSRCFRHVIFAPPADRRESCHMIGVGVTLKTKPQNVWSSP